MKTPNNPDEALRALEKIEARIIERVLTQSSQVVRQGEIIKVNNNGRSADVQVIGTAEIFKGIRYPRGTGTVNVGDPCLIASPDPKSKNSTKIIGIY